MWRRLRVFFFIFCQAYRSAGEATVATLEVPSFFKLERTLASTRRRRCSHLRRGRGSWHPPKRSRRFRIWG